MQAQIALGGDNNEPRVCLSQIRGWWPNVNLVGHRGVGCGEAQPRRTRQWARSKYSPGLYASLAVQPHSKRRGKGSITGWLTVGGVYARAGPPSQNSVRNGGARPVGVFSGIECEEGPSLVGEGRDGEEGAGPPRAAKWLIARPASHTSWFMEVFQFLRNVLTLEHSSRRAASSQVVMHSGRVRRRTKDRDLPSW